MQTRSKTTRTVNLFGIFMNMEQEQFIKPLFENDPSLEQRLHEKSTIYIPIENLKSTDTEQYIDAFSCVYPSFVWRMCKPRNGIQYVVGFPCSDR